MADVKPGRKGRHKLPESVVSAGGRAIASEHSPHQNHLLDALPALDFERLAPNLELITLKLGDVLYEPGAQMRYVYFPTTAIVSLLYVMEDGASAEIAVVGNDGAIGVAPRIRSPQNVVARFEVLSYFLLSPRCNSVPFVKTS